MEDNRKYCLHFFLEMSHSFDGNKKFEHNHTLEITLYLKIPGNGVVRFSDLERGLNGVLQPFQERYLNDISMFKGDTTIENIGEITCSLMNSKAEEMGIDLYRYEIAETPLRTYVITSEP